MSNTTLMLFSKPNYVNQFIINIKNYSDQDIYNYILDRLREGV